MITCNSSFPQNVFKPFLMGAVWRGKEQKVICNKQLEKRVKLNGGKLINR